MNTEKPILLMDFDGVIHSYITGWRGPRTIPDPPTDGAIRALLKYMDVFSVCIYSARSRHFLGKRAMKRWLIKYLVEYGKEADISALPNFNPGMDPWDHELEYWATDLVSRIEFPTKKPAAFMTIDDRCHCFDGRNWPDGHDLRKFKPWNRL